MSSHGPDATTLARIAEQAMIEQKFIPHAPPEAQAQAAAAVEPAQSDGLKDLRQLPWTSIDNPESQDLDQIEATQEEGDSVRLFVGIADVDVFVPRGSPIDAFAGANTTSVYTGVRTFPMLPERLSFDLSSLLADKPRFAVITETLLGPDGTLRETHIYPALVVNHAKLDYPSVSAWLDGKGPAPAQLAARKDLADQIHMQDRLSQALAAARKKAGALDVDTEQTRPVVENGQVVRMEAHHQDRAGRIIEELMIASNRAVAHSFDQAGRPSIRRVVKEPARWARIVAYAAERGGHLPAGPDSKALSGFVEKMRQERPMEFGEISLAIVKLMGRGEYVAHVPGAPEIGHFGLATTEYTHSTAPNRRYPDLIAQRLIKALGHNQPSPYSAEELSQIAQHCSEREAAAEKVERRVHKSAAASLLRPFVGKTFDAVVTGASDKGTFVKVFSPMAEGKMVSGSSGLAVGDKVKVTLRDTNVERGFIDFTKA